MNNITTSKAVHRRAGSGFAVGLIALAAATTAQSPSWGQGPNKTEPPAIKEQQDLRFPQTVRVGTLITWPVIAVGGRYKKLGTVIGVFQPSDDDPVLVFRYGAGLFGSGRIIAPSLQDVSLVGPMVKIADLGPSDLAKLPTFKAMNGVFLKPDDMVKIGVDKKY